jgi:hypothetical protein
MIVGSILAQLTEQWPIPPQAHDAPDGHHRVENHRRPQRHAVQSKADAGEREDGNGSDVVKATSRRPILSRWGFTSHFA